MVLLKIAKMVNSVFYIFYHNKTHTRTHTHEGGRRGGSEGGVITEGQGDAVLLKMEEGSGAKGRSSHQKLDRPGRRLPKGS